MSTIQGDFGAIQPIFRGPFLSRVARNEHILMFEELAEYHLQFSPPKSNSTLSDWFQFFYDLLFQHYRGEYIYKNTIANKIYLEHESLSDSLFISEMQSGDSRADVVIINGTSSVYEIKTEYDTLDRLDGQLEDYRKVFDEINVVTTQKMASLVMDRVDDVIGVIYLSDEGNLEYSQHPKSNKKNTDPATLFNCLRQAEFCKAIEIAFDSIPDVPSAYLYRECIELFISLDSEYAHDLMVECVKIRGKQRAYIDLITSAPACLKHACLEFSRPQSMAIQIQKKLREPFKCRNTFLSCEEDVQN